MDFNYMDREYVCAVCGCEVLKEYFEKLATEYGIEGYEFGRCEEPHCINHWCWRLGHNYEKLAKAFEKKGVIFPEDEVYEMVCRVENQLPSIAVDYFSGTRPLSKDEMRLARLAHVLNEIKKLKEKENNQH